MASSIGLHVEQDSAVTRFAVQLLVALPMCKVLQTRTIAFKTKALSHFNEQRWAYELAGVPRASSRKASGKQMLIFHFEIEIRKTLRIYFSWTFMIALALPPSAAG